MKKNLKELRAELAAKKTAARALLAEYNTLTKKASTTEAEAAQIIALDAKLTTAEDEVSAAAAELEAEETVKRRGELFHAGSVHAYGEGGRSNDPDPTRTFGFKSAAEFALCVYHAQVNNTVDDRLRNGGLEANTPATYQQNQGGGGEGFLVPPDYSKTVWDLATDETDLLGMTNPEPTASNAVGKPKDETTPWGSAGVQAYWGAEAGLYKASTALVTAELMTLHKLYAFVAATDEILADGPMLKNRITIQAGKAIGWTA